MEQVYPVKTPLAAFLAGPAREGEDFGPCEAVDVDTSAIATATALT